MGLNKYVATQIALPRWLLFWDKERRSFSNMNAPSAGQSKLALGIPPFNAVSSLLDESAGLQPFPPFSPIDIDLLVLRFDAEHIACILHFSLLPCKTPESCPRCNVPIPFLLSNAFLLVIFPQYIEAFLHSLQTSIALRHLFPLSVLGAISKATGWWPFCMATSSLFCILCSSRDGRNQSTANILPRSRGSSRQP